MGEFVDRKKKHKALTSMMIKKKKENQNLFMDLYIYVIFGVLRRMPRVKSCSFNHPCLCVQYTYRYSSNSTSSKNNLDFLWNWQSFNQSDFRRRIKSPSHSRNYTQLLRLDKNQTKSSTIKYKKKIKKKGIPYSCLPLGPAPCLTHIKNTN